MSKGYKQRVGLAAAMMGDPEVLILDEPTTGLDPNQLEDIRALIRELGKNHTIAAASSSSVTDRSALTSPSPRYPTWNKNLET